MDDLKTDLDKAAQLLKIQQIPGIFAKIKEAVELYYGVGLHLIDHPINGLATAFAEMHATMISAEKRHEEWLVATYNEKTVPQPLAQAWAMANAKLNPSGPVLSPPVAPLGGLTAAQADAQAAPVGVVDELAAARAAVAEAKAPEDAEHAEAPAPEAQP